MKVRDRKKRARMVAPRRPASRSRRRRLLSSLLIAIFLVLGLVIGGWMGYPYLWAYISHPDRFKIEKIVFQGCEQVEESELRRLLPPIEGVNLFAVDLKNVRERLCRHPWLLDVSLHRRLPDRLLIRVTERKPAAIVNTDRLYALDRHGIVLHLDNWKGPLDLPIVRVKAAGELKPGSKLKEERASSLLPGLESLRRRLPDLWGAISEAYWDNEGQLYLLAFNRPTPILLGENPSWRQMLNFYSFLNYQGHRWGMDDVNFVDLRFPGQVIIRRDESSHDSQVRLAAW